MPPHPAPLGPDELARQAPALRNRQGRAFEAEGRLDLAMDAYRQALRHDPLFGPAAANLARLLVALDRPAEAAALLEPVMAAAPYDMPLAVNYANALLNTGRAVEAQQRLRAVVAAGNAPAQAYNSLGIASYVQRDFEGAVDSFARAVTAAPDFAEAHENLAQALLQLHRDGEAWPEYEWRWRNPSNAITKRAFAQPQWDGSPLEGRTLLLHGEQGFGDTIQFARFAGLIDKDGGRILLACQPALVRLFAGLAGVDAVFAHGDALPPFDCHAPLLSLPRLMGTEFETIPDPSPYLSVEPDSASPIASAQPEPVRIGVNWAGRPLFPQDPHRNRSCPAALFAPLAALPGAVLYNLHFGDAVGESAALPLHDFARPAADFADSARMVAALDLVVTVDTALAHLAGAMGKPCWVLLPYAADWRWSSRADGTQPWYRSVHPIRQSSPGDWDGVLRELEDKLSQHIVCLRGSAG